MNPIAIAAPLATIAAPAIPAPRTWPLVGNVPSIDPNAPVASLMKLARELGPIFRLTLPTQRMLVLSGRDLVADACDESRFEKHVHGPLQNIRDFAGDGLFTAHAGEENWGKAHRILMPAFSPAAMKNYFDDMLEIADQMFLKWERLGPDVAIDVPDAMTRLTLDTIALCGFGYRFNSFYQGEMHPFVAAMVRGLAEAGRRTKRLPLQTQLMLGTRRQYEADTRFMHEVTDAVVSRRRTLTAAEGSRDLLGLMLEGRDPISGEGLDDANIRNQLVTFLIAGHETTSGLLSFATHFIMANPAVAERAQREVDEVLGNDMPRFDQIPKLVYLDQVLRETLRLYPTAPAIAVHAKADTRLGDRYPMKAGEVALALLPSLHRDPMVWSDPERFSPERFAEPARGALPSHAWLPFGNGMRACIGRSFALQEATLVLAMMLQRFEIARPAPYELVVKETLTLKPEGLLLRARRRPKTAVAAREAEISRPSASLTTGIAIATATTTPAHGVPLLVLFGSNTGSAEAFARRIAGDAAARGYQATVDALDAHAGKLPTAGAIIIVTASYNGEPPDNARRFCDWLATTTPGSLTGVRYAVFGCGNRDWAASYQRVPQTIDERMAAAGATALKARGEADARADFFGDFERWYEPMWPALDAALGATAAASTPAYAVELVPGAVELCNQNRLTSAEVLVNRELCDLSSPFGRSKRHLEIALPPGTSYAAGDYLAILPENHPTLVERAAARFGLKPAQTVVLRSERGALAGLPIDRPITVADLLARHVELGAPATRPALLALAASNPCPPHRRHLESLAADEARMKAEILEPRVSVLDLLERYPSCLPTFAGFLELLPVMRVRQYSISSSPLVDPTRCSLTAAIVEAPAWSGMGRFHGTCSSYLARLRPGDTIAVAVRSPHAAFRPPADNARPIILIAAGTGIAPFRGFIQERSLRRLRGEEAGPTWLFFGCDHPHVDFLYRDELDELAHHGLLEVFSAFHRQPASSDDGEVTFVQHRLWQERSRVAALLDRGAHVYVCGDGLKMAPAVRTTLQRIHCETAGVAQAEGEAWLIELEREDRYAADVFG